MAFLAAALPALAAVGGGAAKIGGPLLAGLGKAAPALGAVGGLLGKGGGGSSPSSTPSLPGPVPMQPPAPQFVPGPTIPGTSLAEPRSEFVTVPPPTGTDTPSTPAATPPPKSSSSGTLQRIEDTAELIGQGVNIVAGLNSLATPPAAPSVPPLPTTVPLGPPTAFQVPGFAGL